jgi:hypothetical protein
VAWSYAEVVRIVRLHASTAPLFLVREWVNTAYAELASQRRWSFLVGELTLTVQDGRDLASVAVTQGSATVVSVGLFLPEDAGRQFRVGTYPYYTILSVPDSNTIVLDRVYGGRTSVGTTGQILDAYATMPADFASFRAISDPTTDRPFAWWPHADLLLQTDPNRTVGGTPRGLVNAPPSPYVPTLGQVRYEWWPVSTTAIGMSARYNRQEDRLTDSDVFTGVLKDGGMVLVNGALAQAAEWPGTSDVRNPYFNLPLAESKRKAFLAGIQTLSLRDDEQAPEDLFGVDWARALVGDLPRTDHALRASDATLSDYL